MSSGPQDHVHGSEDHEDVRILLAAYVLGGVDPDDRRRVEGHLSSCPVCRVDLVRLAPLPGLLNRVPAAARGVRAAGSPDDDLLRTLLGEVRRDRAAGRRRTAGWAAGAAAAAVAGVVGVGAVSGGGEAPQEPPPTVVTLAAATTGGPQGQAELTPRLWGTAMTLRLAGLPPVGPFVLEVTGTDGTRQRAATWGPTPGGTARVSGATSLPAEAIDSVVVLGPDGPLLTDGA